MTNDAATIGSSFGLDLPRMGGSFDVVGTRRYTDQEGGAAAQDQTLLEFRPISELGAVSASPARVIASELFLFAALAFVASLVLTVLDVAAGRNAVSGTLILMLFVAAIGLMLTGWVAQKKR